jgi:tetratricopeptide (TPR) repeat protein
MGGMKKTIFLAGLLALAGCADTSAESFAKAKAEFAAHDYATARILVAAALETDPGNREFLLLQAKTLIALGDGDGAGTALDGFAKGGPMTGEVAELAAEAALLRKAPDAALKVLGDAASPEAERLRAMAALQKPDFKSAQDHFEKAMAAGGNARVFADYARFRLASGDIAGADELAARAAKAAPDGIDTLLIEGQLALRHGDLKLSLDKYARASQLYPNSLAALTGRAAVLGDLGRIKEMDEAVARAAAQAPRDPAVVFLKAKSAEARKDWAGARATLQPVEATLDQLDPLRQIYAEALLRLGQAELAVAQLQPIARAMPNNRDAHRLLGEAQLASGDAAGALATLKPLALHPAARTDELALAAKAARAAGDPAAGHFEYRAKLPAAQALGRDLADGDAAMRAGNWGGATAAYQKVLAVTDGRNVMVLNNMAYAQTMLGNHEAALQFAHRAIREAPDNASVLDTAGWAQFKSGTDLAEAKRLLRRAAQLAPQNVTIRAHLAEAERARN